MAILYFDTSLEPLQKNTEKPMRSMNVYERTYIFILAIQINGKKKNSTTRV